MSAPCSSSSSGWRSSRAPSSDADRTATTSRFEPAYLRLRQTGQLANRVRLADEHLAACDLCARACRVDRHVTVRGAVCRTGARAIVASFGPHHGEEAPLSGRRGSGTIFFGWCNLRCVFCQNWEISQRSAGGEVTAGQLAAIMLELQALGCHNINLVSPSHVVAQVISAVAIGAAAGLRLPLVYNTGGYDSPEALALLDGIVDIYMPDMKYGDDEVARRCSRCRDYVAVNRAAVREMHRQVGDLDCDEEGIARRGLLVRHLVLPNGLARTAEVVEFIAREISPNTYLNLMAQYHPAYRAGDQPELARRPTNHEYAQAMALAAAAGLTRLDARPGPAVHARER